MTVERKTGRRRRRRRHSDAGHPQAYRRAGAFGGRLCLPDPLSAHASGICRAVGQERQGARKRELPYHREPEALVAAVPDSAWHGQAERHVIAWEEDGLTLEKLVRRDGQFAYALAGGMVDSIRDRRRHSCNRDFARAARPDIRIDVWVRLVDEVNLNRVNVSIHRHSVIRQVAIHDAAIAMVINRVLHQGHSDAHDDSAVSLALHGFAVDYLADIKRSRPPRLPGSWPPAPARTCCRIPAANLSDKLGRCRP